METEQLIQALAAEGQAIARDAVHDGLGGAVPACPGWRVRDVLVHLGSVHRWATECVVGRMERPPVQQTEEDILSGGPDDDSLVAWFTDGHRSLLDALHGADETLECWTFLPAPSARAFWARRQAHETAVHRADVAQAGARAPRFSPRFAADGIDELVMGFAPTRRSKGRADPSRTLLVVATDTDHRWRVSFGPDAVETARGDGPSDGWVRAPASDLYLLLWNRLDPAAAQVSSGGDVTLLDLWRSSLRVRWG